MKDGFETFRNFDIGLGASPVTYTSKDHRPSSGCVIQQYRSGAFHKLTTVDLAKRYPTEWSNRSVKGKAESPKVIPGKKPDEEPTTEKIEEKLAKLVWNLWSEKGFSAKPFYVPLPFLKPETKYRLVLHLSAIPYLSITETKATEKPFQEGLMSWLRETTMVETSTATAVALADPARIRIVGDSHKDMEISLKKIRKWLVGKDFSHILDPLKYLRENQQCAFLFGDVSFTIRTTKLEGKAPIGISIWIKDRPVDEITTELCVAKDKDTADKLRRDRTSIYPLVA
ncbi:MAG: hypothetical protein JRJ47_14345 [Deltaproteobacteria bacterium]|nr:hypothetical protein [Deltaproteobacteria bacterium]